MKYNVEVAVGFMHREWDIREVVVDMTDFVHRRLEWEDELGRRADVEVMKLFPEGQELAFTMVYHYSEVESAS